MTKSYHFSDNDQTITTDSLGLCHPCYLMPSMALKETMSKESAMMAINATSKMSHQKVTVLGTMTKSYHFSDNDQTITTDSLGLCHPCYLMPSMALKETMSKESAMMAINATSKMSHQKVTVFRDNDQKLPF